MNINDPSEEQVEDRRGEPADLALLELRSDLDSLERRVSTLGKIIGFGALGLGLAGAFVLLYPEWERRQGRRSGGRQRQGPGRPRKAAKA